MKLTSEQTEIINCQFNNTLLINAFAWTWKTTTLVEFCKARPNNKILYLCYNRWLKEEAVEKFKNLKNVKVSTIHSIAYKEVWFRYSQKLWNLRPYDLAKYFHWDMKYYYWYYSLLILKDFLNSWDTFEIYFINLNIEIDNILKWFGGKYNSNILINSFSNIWKDLLKWEKLKIEHDVYLKLYQLSNPNLAYFDYILIDEAQDINWCMLDIILNQETKKIFIWDSFQQIYQWRWSKNTFKILENENDKVELFLTWSFRCAKNITDIANQYLKILWATSRIQWLNKKRTNLDNQTIIWRTNAGIMKYIIENKWNVFYVGGFHSYNFNLLLEINYLYNSDFTKINNPFIKLFSNFVDLKLYSEEWKDQEIKTIIKLFEEIIWKKINISELRWIENIEELVKILEIESTTDYLYSTYSVSSAHKSKWLEWENVVLLNDFEDINEALKEIEKLSWVQKQEKLERLFEEINILYVACTRAKQKIYIPNNCIISNDEVYKLENLE